MGRGRIRDLWYVGSLKSNSTEIGDQYKHVRHFFLSWPVGGNKALSWKYDRITVCLGNPLLPCPSINVNSLLQRAICICCRQLHWATSAYLCPWKFVLHDLNFCLSVSWTLFYSIIQSYTIKHTVNFMVYLWFANYEKIRWLWVITWMWLHLCSESHFNVDSSWFSRDIWQPKSSLSPLSSSKNRLEDSYRPQKCSKQRN